MYPFKFNPILKSTIWGGEKIIPFKHLNIEQPQVGESWEISNVPGDESVVANGTEAGKNLSQLVKEYKGSLVGESNYQRFGDNFPLLIKFIDAGQESYSSTFFKTQKGNKVLTDVNELKFKDGRNIGVNYMPDADSPVLTAASFNDALLSSGFETVEYIGAFGTDDNWLDGWTNFDPNNTDY